MQRRGPESQLRQRRILVPGARHIAGKRGRNLAEGRRQQPAGRPLLAGRDLRRDSRGRRDVRRDDLRLFYRHGLSQPGDMGVESRDRQLDQSHGGRSAARATLRFGDGVRFSAQQDHSLRRPRRQRIQLPGHLGVGSCGRDLERPDRLRRPPQRPQPARHGLREVNREDLALRRRTQ